MSWRLRGIKTPCKSQLPAVSASKALKNLLLLCMLKKLIILLVAFSFITNAQNNFTYKTCFKTITPQTTDAENKQFQMLLSKHNAIHLEKAERELIKIQNLLTEQ